MLVTHANTETMELTILGMAVLGDFALRELNQPLLCHTEGFVNGFSRSSPATQREPIVEASYQEPESVVSTRETIPSPPAPAPVQLPTSSEELQAFIDKRIKSLEAMYGSSQWTSGPAPSLPYRWV